MGTLAVLLAVGCASAVLPGCSAGRPEEIPYSHLKQRIAAGSVGEVRLSDSELLATPTEDARRAGAPPAGWRSTPIPNDVLVPLLEANGVTYQGIRPDDSSQQLLVGLLTGFLLVVGVVLLINRKYPMRGLSMLGRGRLRARDARRRQTDTRFEDVAGVDEAKGELEEVVKFLKEPARFVALGARVPKGALLVGPPGTGKTLLARAVAGEACVPFFSVSASEFIEVFVGVGASRVRKLFEEAKSKAPAIIFIDELDAIGKSRTGGSSGGTDEREQTLNQLLVEMDGFDSRDGIVVLAATNRPEILDAALLRPGRFDRQVLVDRPDGVGRQAILQVHARKVKLGEDVQLEVVARRTPGLAGADLENVLNEAALLAARSDKPAIGMLELDAAVDRVLVGLERKSRLTHVKERRIVAYHEAGHAIVAEMTATAEPVYKVSIVPRGLGALGYMQQTPEDRLLLQEDELLDRLTVLLGGRAAERIAFNKYSTGASNDLERATALAQRMICEFGMSPTTGPVAFQAPDGRGRRSTDAGEWSDRTTSRIEAEVQSLLSTAFDRACSALEKSEGALERVADALLVLGTLDREQFLALLAEESGR